MSEADVARAYDRWLTGPSISGRLYGLLAGLPGMVLVNTPAFKLNTELQIKPEQRVLNIGCGTGALLQTLDSRVRFQTPPVGIDISRTMIARGRRATENSPRRIDLLRAAGTALPFADERFDLVTCAHTLKHLDDESMLALMREVRRVLQPGGIALVWEFAPTNSPRLNAWNRFVLSPGVGECNLRDYATLSAYALEAGFEWVGNARLRPFLYPPIPRVSMLLGKAPPGWTSPPGAQHMVKQ